MTTVTRILWMLALPAAFFWLRSHFARAERRRLFSAEETIVQKLSNIPDPNAMSAPAVAQPSDASAPGSETTPTDVSREDRVRLAAYAAAERRGFVPGHEVEDWLAAEQEVDAARGDGPSSSS